MVYNINAFIRFERKVVMNVGLKKYNINDYYFAEIKNKNADFTKQEIYTTILLKKGDTYVD